MRMSYYMQSELPCHRTSLIKWRNRLGEKGSEELLKETIRVSKRRGLTKRSCKKSPSGYKVQEKNISFPTDSKLIQSARELKCQTYVRKGKQEAVRGGTKQFTLVRSSDKRHREKKSRNNREDAI